MSESSILKMVQVVDENGHHDGEYWVTLNDVRLGTSVGREEATVLMGVVKEAYQQGASDQYACYVAEIEESVRMLIEALDTMDPAEARVRLSAALSRFKRRSKQ